MFTFGLTALKWIGAGFTGALGGLQALAFKFLLASAAISIAAFGGYISGRIDCAAKHNVAALRATIAEMEAREKAREAVEAVTGELAAKEEKEAKRVDEALDRAEAAINRTIPAGVCATLDFLRSLRSAR